MVALEGCGGLRMRVLTYSCDEESRRGATEVIYLPDPPMVAESAERLAELLLLEVAGVGAVHAAELCGFGMSDSPASHTMEGSVLQLEGLVRALAKDGGGAARFVVVAPCAAAHPAAAAAQRCGALVRALVIVQAPCFDQQVRWARRIDGPWRMLSLPVVSSWFLYFMRNRVAADWVRAMFSSSSDAYDARDSLPADALAARKGPLPPPGRAQAAVFREHFTAVAQAALGRGARYELSEAVRGVLLRPRARRPTEAGSLRLPAAVVYGDRDPSHTLRGDAAANSSDLASIAELWADGCRPSEHPFEGTGHFPELQCPRRFCAVVAELLERRGG